MSSYLLSLIPFYVYKIIITKTVQFYYGSRYQHVKLNRHPIDDLWIKYFTSSIHIKALIDKYGKDSFTSEIIFESIDKNETFWHEQDLIKYDIKNPLCLNRSYKDKDRGQKLFCPFGSIQSEKSKLIKSLKTKGISKSTEHNKKNSEAHKGKLFSDEHKKNISLSRLGKHYPNASASQKRKRLTEDHKRKVSEGGKGIRWWNNGKINIRSRINPGEGFIPGRNGRTKII